VVDHISDGNRGSRSALVAIRDLIARFEAMIRGRNAAALDPWIA
jgi:hypothetical protein